MSVHLHTQYTHDDAYLRHTQNINYLRHMPFIINYILLWHSIVFTSISPCSTSHCTVLSSNTLNDLVLLCPKTYLFNRNERENKKCLHLHLTRYHAKASSRSFFSNLILDICLHITSIVEWCTVTFRRFIHQQYTIENCFDSIICMHIRLWYRFSTKKIHFSQYT